MCYGLFWRSFGKLLLKNSRECSHMTMNNNIENSIWSHWLILLSFEYEVEVRSALGIHEANEWIRRGVKITIGRLFFATKKFSWTTNALAKSIIPEFLKLVLVAVPLWFLFSKKKKGSFCWEHLIRRFFSDNNISHFFIQQMHSSRQKNGSIIRYSKEILSVQYVWESRLRFFLEKP